MMEILGVKFINEKEAAQRYGYSKEWFQKQRYKRQEPSFVKSPGKGKVYYPLDETDKWFKDNMKIG